jgi:glycosyltransferase involved in cell wall biosynthesis
MSLRIILFTHDLLPTNTHLMPWRTIIEVATHLRRHGHNTIIYSAGRDYVGETWQAGNAQVINVEKPWHDAMSLRRRLEDANPDLIYWPFSWRPSKQDRLLLAELDARKIGYIPGARYYLSAVARALPHLGIRTLAPYIFQALCSDRAFARAVKSCGISQLITMTEMTRRAALNGGLNDQQVHTIWPGVDPVEDHTGPTPHFDQLISECHGDTYFLFFSPPTPIRGTNTVLDAFNRLSLTNKTVRLVCLFRSDANVDMTAFKKSLSSKLENPQITALWDSVSRAELSAFLENTHAAVLPFLLIPSEIPLAVIEAAGHGTPVITTSPSGTGEFVKAYGDTVRVADVTQLQQAMQRMLLDKAHYNACQAAAHETYQQCKDWPGVAEQWLKVGQLDG